MGVNIFDAFVHLMGMETGDGESLLYQILAPEPLLESLLLRLQQIQQEEDSQLVQTKQRLSR